MGGPEPSMRTAKLIFVLNVMLNVGFIATTFFEATCMLPDDMLTKAFLEDLKLII